MYDPFLTGLCLAPSVSPSGIEWNFPYAIPYSHPVRLLDL